MDNTAMVVRAIPEVGTGPVSLGARGGTEAQEAQEAKDMVDEGKEEYKNSGDDCY